MNLFLQPSPFRSMNLILEQLKPAEWIGDFVKLRSIGNRKIPTTQISI